MCLSDQKWILFPLLISTHEILSMSESTVLKFNWFSDSFLRSSTSSLQERKVKVLISAHEILSMSESTVLKFNWFSDSFLLNSTLIYTRKYRLQWVWVQCWHQTYNIRNMFDSYGYSFRSLDLEKYVYE